MWLLPPQRLISLFSSFKRARIHEIEYNRNSVYDVYRPFFFASKLFGMGTSKFRKKEFENCRTGLFVFILNLFVIAWLLIEQEKANFSFSKVLSMGILLIGYLPIVATLMFLVFNFRHRKKLHELFLKLDYFDKKVKRLNSRNDTHFAVCRLRKCSKYFTQDSSCSC